MSGDAVRGISRGQHALRCDQPHVGGSNHCCFCRHSTRCFFAGAFVANFVPHFVQGISGNRFPTPFAKPPGKGLSSPTVNVVWALLNLAIGYVLVRIGKVSAENTTALALFFVGVGAISIMLSVSFRSKHSD